MGSNDEKMERREKMKVALCLHGLVGSPSAKSYDAETPLDGKKICAELAFKDWKKYAYVRWRIIFKKWWARSIVNICYCVVSIRCRCLHKEQGIP